MRPREIDRAAEQVLRARAKEELRQRMRSVRRVLPDTARAERSRAICERLCALPELSRARTVIGYVAYKKEADPRAVLQAAEQRGKSVGLVRVEQNGDLCLHTYREGDPLVRSAMDIAEPDQLAPRIAHEEVELIIVPALAVDASGYRIGYGQGYYDRLLPKLDRAFKVAIVYDFQLLVETPITDGDVPVDCVVTDARTLRTSEG